MSAVAGPIQTPAGTLDDYFFHKDAESVSVASQEASKLKYPRLPYRTLLKLTLFSYTFSST